MITFLVRNNEWYLNCGVKFSDQNLDALFDETATGVDNGVLQSMQIEHATDDVLEDWVDEVKQTMDVCVFVFPSSPTTSPTMATTPESMQRLVGS
jgi:hypothetical protein